MGAGIRIEKLDIGELVGHSASNISNIITDVPEVANVTNDAFELVTRGYGEFRYMGSFTCYDGSVVHSWDTQTGEEYLING